MGKIVRKGMKYKKGIIRTPSRERIDSLRAPALPKEVNHE